MPDRGARLMAATFNAPQLPAGRPGLPTTRPAVAAPGGAAPSSDVGAAAAVTAHEAKVEPHPQYGERLDGLEQAPVSACRCHELERRILALEQANL